MEILNCQYENHKLEIKEQDKTKDLANLVVKIQENFFDIEDDMDSLYILENMRMYEAIFGDRSKYGGKNISLSEERAVLIRIVCQQIGKEKPYCLNFKKNNKKLKIDYLCLESIATVIKKMLENIIDKEDFHRWLDEIIEKNNFSSIMNCEIWGMPLKQIKTAFNQVEELSFELSGNNDDEFDINYISITINLDVFKASKKISELKNPYDFKVSKVGEISKSFDNLFLANFLITCIIAISKDAFTLNKLKIKSSESYINENNYIICNEYKNKNIKEKIRKEKGFILFKKLMKIKTMTSLSFSINCLDRFLFKEIINFIAMRQTIKSLELNLFFNPKFFNKRKIYLNYLGGQDFTEIDPNTIDKYGIVYFPYIRMLGEDIMSIIEEEKIPDLLYPEFKKNLNNLKIILNQYIITLNEFSLDITPYDELIKYENYSVQIILFILVIFFSLEKSKEIETIKLKCSNYEYLYVSQIMKRINKLITPRLIDLSKCEKLKKLELDVQGISLFIDFDKLPFNSLQKLDISISNLKDMEKVSAFLKNNKNNLFQLTQLNISLLFVYDTNFIMKEFIKIFENIPPCIKELIINNENLMRKEEILEILKKIRNNKISFICKLECVCPEIEKFASDKKLNDFQTFLNTKGNIKADNLKLILESKKCINIDFILFPDVDKINSIIFCLNKIIKDSGDKKEDQYKKIYSNIIKFMAKRQNISILLN